jgi:hypothetical protein
MLITCSLPAKVPTHPPVHLPSPRPAHVSSRLHRPSSLPESTSMQAVREASWLPFSSAANQRCRSGLSACHEGCRVLDERTQIARPRWTNTDTAASGTLRLRSEAGLCDQAKWSLLSASRAGKGARCECLPAEDAV